MPGGVPPGIFCAQAFGMLVERRKSRTAWMLPWMVAQVIRLENPAKADLLSAPPLPPLSPRAAVSGHSWTG
jgi:hypothetical protein